MQAKFKDVRIKFNAITLREPAKAEYHAFRDHNGPRPDRRAFVIVLFGGECHVTEILVSLSQKRVLSNKTLHDVMPILTLEDLDVCERVARSDPKVVEVCKEIGIDDINEVYFDGWAIGADERFGFDRRLQQGLAYWRANADDNQYAHPLDFAVVIDTEKEEVLRIDIRKVNGQRVPVPKKPHNFLPQFIQDGYITDRLKPIDVTQPKGVSFTMNGNELSWAGFHMHIGFNYREGIVISDVSVDDMYEKRRRSIFNRLSVAEMVVPYGNPDNPHHRKHAFDIGEYGMGLMTNPLKAGCDCKGAIKYLDAIMSNARGDAAVLPNAVCIHEEDNGLLYKHTDYRDGTVVSARDRKLIISQVITAANYEYGFYHTFSLDGTYKLEVKLTGILNTVPTVRGRKGRTLRHGGRRLPQRAQPPAHLLPAHRPGRRRQPQLRGPKRRRQLRHPHRPSRQPVRQRLLLPENPPQNLHPDRRLQPRHLPHLGHHQPEPATLHLLFGRTTKTPPGYKIISRESPHLLCKPGSLVWRRAAFTRHTLWVTSYRDHELFPAGDYVCQSTGQPGWPANESITDWADRDDNIVNTDIVVWLQFGLSHFPRLEDFPLMPAEPVSVMLRASNFFEKNPALWVPPASVDVDGASRDVGDEVGCCKSGGVKPEAAGSGRSKAKELKL